MRVVLITHSLDFQREGKDFKQDSRGYVNIKNVQRFSFNNNGTLEDLYEFADGYYDIVKHSTNSSTTIRNR